MKTKLRFKIGDKVLYDNSYEIKVDIVVSISYNKLNNEYEYITQWVNDEYKTLPSWRLCTSKEIKQYFN